ncbi:MAG: LysR substrate-binding domain-containing protein [Nannocystales bacterium]
MDRITALRAFTRLVERGSFTAVAEELQVKQSTVSKWLRALEEDLGAQLVARTTRAISITDAGHRLHGHALQTLEAYDAAIRSVRLDDAELRGRIRMNVPEVFGRLHVVPLVAKFAQRHRHVEFGLVFSDSYVGLVEEGFDLVLRVGASSDSTLRAQTLAKTPRRLVASPGYIRKHGVPGSPADLRAHECLLHSGALGSTWTFSHAGRQHRTRVRGRLRADNSEATLALSRRGLGICLLASWLVDPDIRAGRLVPLLEDYVAPPARVTALTPPGRHLPVQVRAMIDHLREGLAPLREEGPTAKPG